MRNSSLRALISYLQLQSSDTAVINDSVELRESILHRMAHGQLHLIWTLKSPATRWALSICRMMQALSIDFAKICALSKMLLKVLPPVSDLGSLPLQVFPDFELQSLIISLEAPHLLQAGGQVVTQVLHGLLLPEDAPYACQTLSHPGGQAWAPHHPISWWSRTQRSERLSPWCLHRLWHPQC